MNLIYHKEQNLAHQTTILNRLARKLSQIIKFSSKLIVYFDHAEEMKHK